MTAPKRQLLAEIRTAADHGHPFYVYALADNSGVFYVGKGTKGRLFHHGQTNRHDHNYGKLTRIAAAGDGLSRRVVAFFKDELSAYALEAELIDTLPGLTNLTACGRLAPIDKARARARSMLARVVPFEQWRFPPTYIHLWVGPGTPTPRMVYDRLVGELRAETVTPTPSLMEFNARGELIACGYSESHGRGPIPAGWH